MRKSETELHSETGLAWDVTAGIYERDEARDIALLRGGGNSLLAHFLCSCASRGRTNYQ